MTDHIETWKGAYRSSKARKCPFCGNPPMVLPWHGGGPRKRMVMCHHEECPVCPSVSGSTEKRALESWNTRHRG